MSLPVEQAFDSHLFQARIAGILARPDQTMASSSSTASPYKHAFTQAAEDVKPPKSDINALILDYLSMNGYPKAAARFSSEANLAPQQDPSEMRARQKITASIHKGDIPSAIAEMNDLDPEILDHDQSLHFTLLRLQLVELIRKCTSQPGGDITPALQFATSELGPRASRDAKFLEDLEQTMALLVFNHDNLDPPLAALLQPSLRREVADMVNKKILQSRYARSEAAIYQLVRMRLWSENVARNEKKDIPERIELGLFSSDSDGTNSDGTSVNSTSRQENGNGEPMIT